MKFKNLLRFIVLVFIVCFSFSSLESTSLSDQTLHHDQVNFSFENGSIKFEIAPIDLEEKKESVSIALNTPFEQAFLSPNSQKVYFIYQNSNQVHSLDLANGQKREVLFLEGIQSFTISPDGTILYILTENSNLTISINLNAGLSSASIALEQAFNALYHMKKEGPNKTKVNVFSTPNPSLPDDEVTLIASVFPNPGGGFVTFFEGEVILGREALNKRGEASIVVSRLAIGEHNITARFEGVEGVFLASESFFIHLVEEQDFYTIRVKPIVN